MKEMMIVYYELSVTKQQVSKVSSSNTGFIFILGEAIQPPGAPEALDGNLICI